MGRFKGKGKRVEENESDLEPKITEDSEFPQRPDSANKVESFSTNAAFGGALYPDKKLEQLVKYLSKRGVGIYETKGNPKFVAKWNGTGELYLPAAPTVLQVKHELSHYLDFKNKLAKSPTTKEGVQSFVEMGRFGREQSVLERLKNNRIWEALNDSEKKFSVNYVESLKTGFRE